jgi:hypoxanthine phosphoribosyltransferase
VNKLILNHDEYNGLVMSICRDIAKGTWRPDYIVGITRGGLYPAVLISHFFSIPMSSLDISLRDGGDCVSNLGMAEDAYNGKNILVVDDINDSGATINWLMQDWPSGCFPNDDRWLTIWNNNVKFATVVDNLSSKCDVMMDFAGKYINKGEKDVWVEFPYESWWK